MNNPVSRLFYLSLSAAVITFVVIILGVATRLMDAGLGCPDWPGCYGQFLVPTADQAALVSPQPLEPVKAWMEMIHRYAAASLGLFSIVLLGLAIKQRHREPKLVFPAVIIFVMISVQGLFGMLTVTLKLWPVVVTLHLLGGITCLSLLCWMVVICYQSRNQTGRQGQKKHNGRNQKQKINPFYWLAVTILLVQIALGGWTSSNYAGVGCVGFPQCNGEWLPAADFSQGFHLSQEIGPDYLHGQLEASARTAIQLVHRLGALILGLVLLLLWWQQKQSHSPHERWARFATLAYLLQILVAAGLIYFSLPLGLALLHTAVAIIIWLLLLYGGINGMKYQIKEPQRAHYRYKRVVYGQQN